MTRWLAIWLVLGGCTNDREGEPESKELNTAPGEQAPPGAAPHAEDSKTPPDEPAPPATEPADKANLGTAARGNASKPAQKKPTPPGGNASKPAQKKPTPPGGNASKPAQKKPTPPGKKAAAKGSKAGRGAPKTPAGEGVEPARPASGTASPRGVAALAGQWEGTAAVPGLGSVAAVVTLRANGQGLAVATVGGVVEQRSFRVESFRGGTLELVGADGRELALAARLSGDRLVLRHPGLPAMELRRTGPARSASP